MMLCMLLFAGVFFSYKESITVRPETVRDNTIAVRIQNHVSTNPSAQKSVQQEYAVIQKVQKQRAKRRPEERTKNIQKPVQHTAVSERVDTPKQEILERESNTVTVKESAETQKKVIENTPSSDDSAAIASFLQILTASIEKNKTYPRVARRAGYEGVVYVEILLGKQGRILRYTLQKSSSRVS